MLGFLIGLSQTKPARGAKVHDVDVPMFEVIDGARKKAGKIWQSRWSSGEGKLSIQIRGVENGHGGKATMHHNSEPVGDFPVEGSQFKFAWRGQVEPDMPLFEVGDEVVIKIGSQTFVGNSRPD